MTAAVTPREPPHPDRDRDDRLVVVSAMIAVAVAAVGLVAMWLPYAEIGSFSIALVEPEKGNDPWSMDTLPRFVGIALVAVAGVVTIGVRSVRLTAWGLTAGALVGLSGVWATHALGTLSAPGWGAEPGIALRLDQLLPLLALGAVAVGAVGAARSSGGYRPRSAPYVAIAGGGLALVALGLMTRNVLFPPSMAVRSDTIWTDGVPVDLRLLGIALAGAFVVLPVLAATAPDPRIAVGLALGWVGGTVVLGTAAVTGRALVRDGLGAPFVLGAVVVAATAVGLIAWAVSVDRAEDPWARSTTDHEIRVRAHR